MNGPDEKKTLYVGNLPFEVTEPMLVAVFSTFGQCTSCKIMRDVAHRTEPYAFMEFPDHQSANMALNAMNHIKFMGRELRVNWATSPAGGAPAQTHKPETKGFNIFVGDLALEIDDALVKETFKPYGSLLDAKIVRYQDGRSRGYAFLTFEKESDAEDAIKKMDKTWLLNKAIRVNWATRRPGYQDYQPQQRIQPRRFEDVVNEAAPTNTTVYCGGIMENLTEDVIKLHFLEFGQIMDVRVFTDKGFAFIRYDTHDAAASAIANKHGAEINSFTAKCSWGKDGFGTPNFNMPPPGMPTAAPAAAPPTQNYDDYYKQYAQYYQQYQQYYQQPPPSYQYDQYYNQQPSGQSNGNNHYSSGNQPPNSYDHNTNGQQGRNQYGSGGGGANNNYYNQPSGNGGRQMGPGGDNQWHNNYHNSSNNGRHHNSSYS